MDVYAYVHILEERIRELEAREERVRQRLNAQHESIYETVLGCPCAHCGVETADVHTEIEYRSEYCATCGIYLCDTCAGATSHGRCDICLGWYCGTCIAKNPLRRVATRIMYHILVPTSVKNVCARHLEYKYSLYERTADT
jgi:hypothetical protein